MATARNFDVEGKLALLDKGLWNNVGILWHIFEKINQIS